MRYTLFIAVFMLCFGIIVTGEESTLSDKGQLKECFIRLSEIEWTGQESHGPGTSLKWPFGYHSDVEMEVMSTFWITTITPGGFNKTHTHMDEEQIYYILDGEGSLVIGDQKIPAKKGDTAYIPKNIVHGLYNTTDKPLIFLGVSAKVPSLKVQLVSPPAHEYVDATPTFTWVEVPGADTYNLVLTSTAIGGEIWNVEMDNSSPEITYNGKTKLINGNSYYWRVGAISKGKIISISDSKSFIVNTQ
ncbi:cupin domain-containing protein [Candidatus Latescibacterota bacterium]